MIETYMDKYNYSKIVSNKEIYPLLILQINKDTIGLIGKFFKLLFDILLEDAPKEIK